MFCGSCTAVELEDKLRYTTLTNTVYRTGTMAGMVVLLFRTFGWRSGALIQGGFGTFERASDALKSAFRQAGIDLYVVYLDVFGDDYEALMQETSLHNRSKSHFVLVLFQQLDRNTLKGPMHFFLIATERLHV